MRGEGDNPTVGIILCSERNTAVAKYSTLKKQPSTICIKTSVLFAYAQRKARRFSWSIPS